MLLPPAARAAKRSQGKPMSTALKRMTVDEFLLWAEGKDGHWELHDGVPVMMSPERLAHARTKGEASVALRGAVQQRGLALPRLSGRHGGQDRRANVLRAGRVRGVRAARRRTTRSRSTTPFSSSRSSRRARRRSTMDASSAAISRCRASSTISSSIRSGASPSGTSADPPTRSRRAWCRAGISGSIRRALSSRSRRSSPRRRADAIRASPDRRAARRAGDFGRPNGLSEPEERDAGTVEAVVEDCLAPAPVAERAHVRARRRERVEHVIVRGGDGRAVGAAKGQVGIRVFADRDLAPLVGRRSWSWPWRAGDGSAGRGAESSAPRRPKPPRTPPPWRRRPRGEAMKSSTNLFQSLRGLLLQGNRAAGGSGPKSPGVSRSNAGFGAPKQPDRSSHLPGI